MKRETSSRSSLLLMELILAMLFFSMIGAICLQIFVKAHTLSSDARELDGAVTQVSSVAELLTASEDGLTPEDALMAAYSSLTIKGDMLDSEVVISLDSEGNATFPKTAAYIISIVSTKEEDLIRYDISYSKVNGPSIYDLTVMGKEEL